MTRHFVSEEKEMAAASIEGEANCVNLLSNGFEELQIKPKQSKKRGENNNDLLKSLDLGRRKLSSVESQRIVSSLDDCIRKVEIVTLLPFIVENIGRFSVFLGSELVSLIEEYDIVEKNYSKALRSYRKASRASDVEIVAYGDDTSRPSSRFSTSSDWLARADLDDIRLTVDSIRESMKVTLKTIVRVFGKNPSALKALNSERKERAFEANHFVDGLFSLRELVFMRLVTSPGEELERVKQFVNLTMKERKAQITIEKMTGNLDTAIKEKDSEVKTQPFL